jgi:SAM-dependent methyltransferase
VAVTRATYERVAASYAARNAAEAADDFYAARDAWAAALLAGAGAGGANAHGAGAGGAAAGAAPWVLDAGAGPGHHAAAFAARGLRAVAYDLSAAMASLAAARGVPAVLGDLRRLPFSDGAFTGVWSAAALLHVPRADVPATLAEWRRVTVPGGGLALSTATGRPDGWEESPYDSADGRPTPRWFTFLAPDALTAALAAAGWRVTSLRQVSRAREWLEVRAVAA